MKPFCAALLSLVLPLLSSCNQPSQDTSKYPATDDGLRQLAEALLEGGAPGLHFYSMNLARSVSQIWSNLALQDRSS